MDRNAMVLARARLMSLLRQLVIQEIRSRYLGSILGLFWLVLTPLLTLVLYTLVFGTFMKARWGTQDGGSITSFALVLFPGLLIFNLFAECVNRAPSIVVSNPSYIKKVVFPLPLLAFVPVLSALLQFVVGMLVWCGLSAFLGEAPSWRMIMVPMVVLPFLVLILGLVWLLSGLAVYVRDLMSITPIVTQVLMFLSPVLYPVENVPANLRWIFALNPLTFAVEQTRSLLLTKASFPLAEWSLYCVLSILVAWAGLKLFRVLRPGFADVI